jgi:hypothetical protein
MQRLKRVFAIEIKRCRRCGGKLKVIASIEDPGADRAHSRSSGAAAGRRGTPRLRSAALLIANCLSATPLSAARRPRSVARCRAWLIPLVNPRPPSPTLRAHGLGRRGEPFRSRSATSPQGARDIRRLPSAQYPRFHLCISYAPV